MSNNSYFGGNNANKSGYAQGDVGSSNKAANSSHHTSKSKGSSRKKKSRSNKHGIKDGSLEENSMLSGKGGNKLIETAESEAVNKDSCCGKSCIIF